MPSDHLGPPTCRCYIGYWAQKVKYLGTLGDILHVVSLGSARTRAPLQLRLQKRTDLCSHDLARSPHLWRDPRPAKVCLNPGTLWDHSNRTYKRNTGACSGKQGCSAKASSITYSACVFEVLIIQHAKWMFRIEMSSVACLIAWSLNTLRTGLLNCLNARSRDLNFRHRASCI